jgi:hypothetical protein
MDLACCVYSSSASRARRQEQNCLEWLTSNFQLHNFIEQIEELVPFSNASSQQRLLSMMVLMWSSAIKRANYMMSFYRHRRQRHSSFEHMMISKSKDREREREFKLSWLTDNRLLMCCIESCWFNTLSHCILLLLLNLYWYFEK